ncbi:transcription termination factor Rho [Glutamicibacter creatinolyticus]|uniref:transcription termination factor Rho n=1 Tax=Glutamicibacter creatinolyticus TaxID=162496 RepID=UPI0037C08B89
MTETTSLTEGVDNQTSTKSAGLASLKMVQLQQLASQLGITGGSRMRKAELVAAISSHQRGGAVADREAKESAKSAPEAGTDEAAQQPAKATRTRRSTKPAADAEAAAESAEAPAEKKPATRRGSRRVTDSGKVSETADAPAQDTAAQPEPQGEAKAEEGEPRKKNTRRASSKAQAPAETSETPAKAEGGEKGETQDAEKDSTQREERGRGRNTRSRNRRDASQDAEQGSEASDEGQERGERQDRSERADRNDRNDRNGRGRNRRDQQDSSQDDSSEGEEGQERGERQDRSERNERNDRNGRGRNRRDQQDSSQDDSSEGEEGQERGERHERSDRNDRNDRGDRNDRNDRNERGRNRRERNRDRNERNRDRNERNQDRNRRNRRGDNDEPQLSEDDVLLPIAGILDVLENYAFVRTSGYLPGPNDVYVTLGQVKKYNLRKGDAIVGAIRQPREGETPNPRQKFNALVQLTSVNGKKPEDNKERVEFNKLVPLYPTERLRLETGAKQIGPRVIDLVAPIGKGQRGLIVSPPKAGKTLILQSIAQAITTNNPEVHLMMVLVDERPEEVTDMQRTVKGEVIASTFDRPADDHTTVAELAIERAKRLVEMGMDVVVLLDSMTRLGRAYNLAAPASGRILSGGVDSAALYPPKRFFGAARNIENGGSLTILATALVETGSKMDEVIFEEFKGTGNMELRLSRQLAEKRIFPAVDVNASSTRREESLLSGDEVRIMWRLRRMLAGLDTQQALELLTKKIRDTESNAEFLMLVNKTTPQHN